MIKNANDKKSLTELNYIINNMSEGLRCKIPKELRTSIEEQMDKDYILDIDITKKISEQNFMPETNALLSLIISDYIGNDEIKNKWKKFDCKYEEILQDINPYNSNIFNIDNKNNKNKNSNSTYENIQLVEYKQSFFKRLFNKILEKIKKKI